MYKRQCPNYAGISSAANGLAQLNNTYASTLSVASAAQSQYGVLRATATASFNISGTPQKAFTEADASFTDILDFDFAPWNGSVGLLYIAYALAGQISSTGNGNAYGSVVISADPTVPGSSMPIQAYFQLYAAPYTDRHLLGTGPDPVRVRPAVQFADDPESRSWHGRSVNGHQR